MSPIKKKFLIHVLAWLGYYIFWFVQYRTTETDIKFVAEFTLVQMAVHSIAVYINNDLLINKLLYKQLYLKFFSCYLLLALATGSFHFYLNLLLFNNSNKLLYESASWYDAFTVTFLLTIFVTSIPAWYKVNSDRLMADSQAKQLLNDKIEEELKFLKAQINPHFLFNSLNTVFNLIDQDKEEAKKTLVKFSDILRYQLYETTNNTISLLREIEYIYSFAAIEKVRRGKSLEVNIITDISSYVEIPPMLLLTFVENAFKHVSNNDSGNYINIEIKAVDEEFSFSIINSYAEQIKHGRKSAGIGLSNVRRRLNLIYKGNYGLDIIRNEKNFVVNLKIDLNK